MKLHHMTLSIIILLNRNYCMDITTSMLLHFFISLKVAVLQDNIYQKLILTMDKRGVDIINFEINSVKHA